MSLPWHSGDPTFAPAMTAQGFICQMCRVTIGIEVRCRVRSSVGSRDEVKYLDNSVGN